MRKRTALRIGRDYYIKLSKNDVQDFNIIEGEEIDVESSLLTNFFNKFKKKSKK